MFLDVYAGEPGSIHDIRLFKKSHLYTNINNALINFYEDSHIIGDLAYKLSTYLVVGFKNTQRLNNREKNFNYKLSQCHVVIENVFGLLKGRFRRLKYLETIRLDLISLLIVFACILHDICILNNDLAEELVDEIEWRDIREQDNFIVNINEEQENNTSMLKRAEIMNILPI